MTYREGAQLSRAIDNLRAAVNILEDLYFRGKGGYTVTDYDDAETRTEPVTGRGETTCTD